jgi:hypothetical protein
MAVQSTRDMVKRREIGQFQEKQPGKSNKQSPEEKHYD